MTSEKKATPGPWGWQKMGEWVLVGQHGMRPIVLSTRMHGPMKERGFTSLDSERGLLVPFDPTHPDAALIAAAPGLADALEALNEWCVGATAQSKNCGSYDYECPMQDAHKPDDLAGLIENARAALRAAGRLE